MAKRAFQLLLVACLAAGTLWAANDPFVGKWKLNPSKSKLTDQMKVEAIGANKYAIDFGGGATENIVADGTDQPGQDAPGPRKANRASSSRDHIPDPARAPA